MSDDYDYNWQRGTPIADVVGTNEEAAQVVQDYIDGAALRLLREAEPEADIVVSQQRTQVAIFIGPDRDLAMGEGATIAEAADACREALKVHA